MTLSRTIALCVAGIAFGQVAAARAQQAPAVDLAAADARAAATVKETSADEKVVLTHGIMPLPIMSGTVIPDGAIFGAGHIAGIPRLGIPALAETDASLGVSWVMGLRKDSATALPSGLAQTATWSPDVLYKGGAMIGAGARAKGFSVC